MTFAEPEEEMYSYVNVVQRVAKQFFSFAKHHPGSARQKHTQPGKRNLADRCSTSDQERLSDASVTEKDGCKNGKTTQESTKTSGGCNAGCCNATNNYLKDIKKRRLEETTAAMRKSVSLSDILHTLVSVSSLKEVTGDSDSWPGSTAWVLRRYMQPLEPRALTRGQTFPELKKNLHNKRGSSTDPHITA